MLAAKGQEKQQTILQHATRHRFSVADYKRMGEVGILTEDDRVELLDGEIRNMSPVDAKHAAMVKRLSSLINQLIGTKYIIGVQDPVQLHDFSEPLPDISILHWRDDFYEASHPFAEDILLLIEVANTSDKYDRNEKLPRYAAAAIPEVWLLNIAKQTVLQCSQPVNHEYNKQIEHKRGTTLQSALIAELKVSIDSLFTTKHRHQ